jgi:hypothetical protein
MKQMISKLFYWTANKLRGIGDFFAGTVTVEFRYRPTATIAGIGSKFLWVPENECGTGFYGPGTFVIQRAIKFAKKEDCQAWCDNHTAQKWKWVPTQHGFYNLKEGDWQ